MYKRKRLFVDSKVQGGLVLRVIWYWFFSLLTMATVLVIMWLLGGRAALFEWDISDFWHWYGPAAAASLVLLPVVLIDAIRLSNRFVGPMLRLRGEMLHLAAGESAKEIHFRKGDFWQQFAEEFNGVVRRMEQLEAQANRAPTTVKQADQTGALADNRDPSRGAVGSASNSGNRLIGHDLENGCFQGVGQFGPSVDRAS